MLGPVPVGLALQNELPADDLPLSSIALESLKKSYYFGDWAVHSAFLEQPSPKGI